jgi:hypothetical protein
MAADERQPMATTRITKQYEDGRLDRDGKPQFVVVVSYKVRQDDGSEDGPYMETFPKDSYTRAGRDAKLQQLAYEHAR